MVKKRIMPCKTVILSLPQVEYIEAEAERRGTGASVIVREAMQFYIDYKVSPEVMQKLIAKKQRAERRVARQGKPAQDKIAA